MKAFLEISQQSSLQKHMSCIPQIGGSSYGVDEGG